MFCFCNAEVEIQLLKMHLLSFSGGGRIFAAPGKYILSIEDSHKSFNISFKPQLQQWKLMLRKFVLRFTVGFNFSPLPIL